MRQSLLIASAWLNIVALGLWLGATIGIGALVAPAAFRVAPESAGAVVGESLRRLNYLGLGCAAVVLVATALEAMAWRLVPAAIARLALVLAAAGIAWYLGWRMIPTMGALRTAGQSESAEFDRLHTRYELMTKGQFALLLGGALATAAFLAGPRKGEV
jgi:hypothetical protein